MRDRDESGNDPHDLGEGICKRQTKAAILVRFANGTERWIPQSVVHVDSEVWTTGTAEGSGREGRVIVQTWWHEANP